MGSHKPRWTLRSRSQRKVEGDWKDFSSTCIHLSKTPFLFKLQLRASLSVSLRYELETRFNNSRTLQKHQTTLVKTTVWFSTSGYFSTSLSFLKKKTAFTYHNWEKQSQQRKELCPNDSFLTVSVTLNKDFCIDLCCVQHPSSPFQHLM